MFDDLSVLLVDDDDFIRKTVEMQLRKLGISRIETANDGAGALRAVSSQARFDLIIADLMMPNVDGVELLRGLAERQLSAALVLISSLEENVLRSVAVLSRERGLRVLGALRKPVRQEALEQLLKPLAKPKPAAADGSEDDGEDATAPTPAPARLPPPDASALLRAIERGDLKIYGQPLMNIETGELHAVDINICWPRGPEDIVTQAQLTALAYRHKLSGAFVEYVLSRGIHAAATCWEMGLHVPLLLALPGVALRKPDLPDLLDRHLRGAKFKPELFQVAISEHELQDDNATLEVLSRLRMRQIGVCLDNFAGRIGYARLQRLPVSSARINARLMQLGDRARDLLKNAVTNARALGFICYAEGVETEEQASELQALGCEVMQGGLSAPSAPLDDIIEEYRNTDPSNPEREEDEQDAEDAAGETPA